MLMASRTGGPIRKRYVVKKAGHLEHYDRDKIYRSVYSACYVVHKKHEECHRIAKQVVEKADRYVKGTREITTKDIFNLVKKELHKIDKDIHFMYSEHMDIA